MIATTYLQDVFCSTYYQYYCGFGCSDLLMIVLHVWFYRLSTFVHEGGRGESFKVFFS